jgi:hypothetical protein
VLAIRTENAWLSASALLRRIMRTSLSASGGKGIIKPQPDRSSDVETEISVTRTIFDGEIYGFVFIEIV